MRNKETSKKNNLSRNFRQKYSFSLYLIAIVIYFFDKISTVKPQLVVFIRYCPWSCLWCMWRCPWCNGYRRRKWTRRHEFKPGRG